jgi:iron complex outermembrane receptor protein
MYYFSWGKGVKPGGISTVSGGGSPTTIEDERFLSEKVAAWELGAKTDWQVAGFLRVNASLFLNDYTDKQVGTQIVAPDGQLQARVTNAAAAEVWGTEVEAIWQPDFLVGLLLSASYTYLDAKYSDFTDLTRNFVRAAGLGQCPLVGLDQDDNVVAPNPDYQTGDEVTNYCALDLSGNQLERTPTNSFAANAQYTAPFMDTAFDWFVEANAVFEDRRFIDQDNVQFFDDYWLVDARAGFTGEKFEFLVYVDNLFEDDTLRTGGNGPDFAQQVTELGFTAGLGLVQYFGVLPNPRQVGARLTLRF